MVHLPGLRAVVFLTVRSVAQDVIDFRNNMGGHLRKDLGMRESKTEYACKEGRE